MSLATPKLRAAAVNQEHPTQTLTKLLAELHVPVRLNTFVMVRQIDKNEL